MTTKESEHQTTISPLPEGYTIRPPTMDDVKPTVALLNTCSRLVSGEANYSEQETRSEWLDPDWPIADHLRIVTAPGGDLAAYLETYEQSPYVRKFFWIHVHPGHRGKGLWKMLFHWAKAHAESRINLAPAGAQVFMETSFTSTDEYVKAHCDALKMTLARHHYRMAIEFKEEPPAPTIPAGITIRPIIVGREEQTAVRVFDETFKDHWGHIDRPFEEVWQEIQHRIETDKAFDPATWLLALDGETPVGVTLCMKPTEERPGIAWIEDVGVLREYRRRGIAGALLRTAFRDFWKRGYREARLFVDASNLTGATRLYEKCGMHVHNRNDCYRLTLCEGEILGTQAIE